MYARIGTVQILPGKVDELINIFHESILPVAKQQKGFKGGYLLTDRKTSKGISIALWETEADMNAGDTNDYLRQQIAKIIPCIVPPPAMENFEVNLVS